VSVPERSVLEEIAERLAGVLRRQDELEARFLRIEATLGIKPEPAVAPSQLALPIADPAAAPPPPTARSHEPPLPTPSPWPLPGAPSSPLAEPSLRPALPDPAPLAATRATTMTADRPTFESQVGLQWLNRIGVITLLLGVAFAYKTAIDNDWIGPGARIVLGVVAALVTLAIGDIQWRRKHVVFAQGLTAFGLALLYLSSWASFSLYELVPQPVAFGAMVATTIASGLLAMRYASQAIAVIALLGGYVTPIATGEPHSVFFLGYVTVLNIATIVLARRRVWPALELLAAIATAVLYGGWLGLARAADVERPIATVFAGVFYVQYAIGRSRIPWTFAQMFGPIVMALLWNEPEVRLPVLLAFALAGLLVAERRRGRGAPLWTAIWFWLPESLHVAVHGSPIAIELAGTSIAFAGFIAWILWAHVRSRRPLAVGDLALLIGTPAAYFASAASVLEPAYHAYLGGLAVLLTVVYLVLGKLVWQAAGPAQERRPAYLTLGIALAFFTAAVPLELTGFGIAIAWALEAAGLAWLSRRFADDKLSLATCSVLLLALGALALGTQQPVLVDHLAVVGNLRFATFAVLAASLFASARLLREPPRATLAYVIAHLLVLLAIGLELAAGIERSIALADQVNTTTVAISVLMAGYAVMLIVLGVIRRRARDRIMGLVLLAIVVLKLYGSDVWSLGRGFQVAAFLALGALLLGVSYVYSRYRSVIGRLWKDEPAGG
jgi:uncharacterized membrane protein